MIKSRMVIKGESFSISDDEELPPGHDRTIPRFPTSSAPKPRSPIKKDPTQAKPTPYIPPVTRLGGIPQKTLQVPTKPSNRVVPILSRGNGSFSNLKPNSNRSVNSNSAIKDRKVNSVVFAEEPPSTHRERVDSKENFVKPDFGAQNLLGFGESDNNLDRVPKGGWVGHPCLVV